MTAEIILGNAFYAFWFLLGQSYLGLLAVGIIVALMLGIYYMAFKR